MLDTSRWIARVSLRRYMSRASMPATFIWALKRIAYDTQGNFAVMTALVSAVLLATAGGAVDFGHALSVKSDLQGQLDAVVLAAAHEAGGNKIAHAQKLFTNLAAPLAAYNPRAQFTLDENGTLTGVASASVKTTLLTVMAFKKLDVSVASAAVGEASTNGSPCILLLDRGRDALYVNSGAGIQKTDCEIHVHSPAYSAATFTDGGRGLNVKRICIKSGTISYNNQLNQAVEKNCDVAPDPFAGSLPSVNALGCDSQLGGHLPDNQKTHKLSPGVYCGWTDANGSPTIELRSGLYVIKNGGWFFNSGTTLTGKDVTIYLADSSKIFFNGNVDIDLSAPTSGAYKDILMFEAPGLAPSDWLFNGNQKARLDGIIYLPSRNVHFNSTFAMNNSRTGVVFNRMSMDGTNWNLVPLTNSGRATAATGLRLIH
ncbi:TadE/TadG family type IV pilus assembly protein [Rhizobium giardinii]|uniref:Flp pilus assembly protein TadG n=1 Tax=Rhizobium giardinii TaxID=56731 RepID=A0A7W8XA68_9HYPH|nr:TadE/TadG family type IV pilus assembly protein [Rhizobium giardinii]MBB5536358.1 Flp pilus assembly protein TadG [Rhizobium giardinii]